MFGHLSLPQGEWRRHCRAHQQSATRTIKATIVDDSRPKAVKITTGSRTAWLPRSLVSYSREAGTLTMPAWLARQKLLD